MVRFACEEGFGNGFEQLPTYQELLQNGSIIADQTNKDTHRPSVGGVPINIADEESKAARICTVGNTSLAFFKIFGMKHYCLCGGYAAKEDSRYSLFPATDERIRKLLPFEVLSRLAPPIGQSTSYLYGAGHLIRSCILTSLKISGS